MVDIFKYNHWSQNYWTFLRSSRNNKNWFLKRINSVSGQAWCNRFCKGCPIGHICVTPEIINCSCLRVFTKVFGAPPLRPLNKHQLEKFIVSNLHSFSTFMGSYSALAWPCLTGRADTGLVIQQQLLGEHYISDQTWIMGSLQWVYHWLWLIIILSIHLY